MFGSVCVCVCMCTHVHVCVHVCKCVTACVRQCLSGCAYAACSNVDVCHLIVHSDILFTAHLFTYLKEIDLVTCGIIWWKMRSFLHQNSTCMIIINGKNLTNVSKSLMFSYQYFVPYGRIYRVYNSI